MPSSLISPGESQAKDTGERIGSYGQLRGEELQLIYESLSRRKYASVIGFDGGGYPRTTRLIVREWSCNKDPKHTGLDSRRP